MGYYEYVVDIEASCDVTWRVLSDVARWPQWTPSMTKVTIAPPALFTVGAQVDIVQPQLPLARWTITDVQPPISFTWISHALGVTSEATHTLTPLTDTAVRLTLSLRQTGTLAPLLWRVSRHMVQRYIQQEAHGLQQYAEACMREYVA